MRVPTHIRPSPIPNHFRSTEKRNVLKHNVASALGRFRGRPHLHLRAARGNLASPAPSVAALLSTLPKPRLVDLGRQFGVAIAKPNGVPITESVERLVQSGQLVFRELLEWMRRDELRKACKSLGLNDKERSRAALAGSLLQAHGVQSVPPSSIFGDVGNNRITPKKGDVARVRQRQYLVEGVTPPASPTELTRVDLVCLDDDQQGRELIVLWELELGAKVSDPHRGLDSFKHIDPPRHFAAYLHALKWNSVTATDAGLFSVAIPRRHPLDEPPADPIEEGPGATALQPVHCG